MGQPVEWGSRWIHVHRRLRSTAHRATSGWAWPEDAAPVELTVEPHPAAPAHSAGTPASEAVLILNVSGTIQPDELPAEVASLPRFVLSHR
jgi:hypothetical protein